VKTIEGGIMLPTKDLILETASILETAYYKVEINSSKKGIHTDLQAKKDNEVIIVECKSYSKLVGLHTIREFASSIDYFRENEPKIKAWMVTTNGFTANAQKALKNYGLLGFTINDLREKYNYSIDLFSSENKKSLEERSKRSREESKRAFVLMPFSDEMLDVFILGIRWAADKLNVVAERSDDLEHNGEIIQEIRNAISEYEIIIADTTGANPNVCYEVGYAHALGKPTILICRRGENLPFDLQGTNHLFYDNILGLREPLKKKISDVIK
jgi:nucleoside 2-deoxyribosyltransferase